MPVLPYSMPVTPFVVKTDQYSVLVKGTKFNVSSYPEDISAKTTLLEGSIDILYKGRHIPVAPGELLSLDKQNGSFSRQKVQASQYKSWTEGRLGKRYSFPRITSQ